MNIYRHGDVLIKQIDKLPENLKQLKSLTIAEGEATGHHHTIVCDKPNMVLVYQDDNGIKYIQALEDCQITHQEHKTIEIKKGMYITTIEKEFNPFDEEINKVKD